MTVNEIMKNALALCGEQIGGRFFGDFTLAFVNTAICESFAAEKALRRVKNQPEPENIPKMDSANDEVPFSDEVARGMLTFLTARQIALTCDNTDLADRFTLLAERAKQNFAPEANFGEVLDIYSGDDTL